MALTTPYNQTQNPVQPQGSFQGFYGQSPGLNFRGSTFDTSGIGEAYKYLKSSPTYQKNLLNPFSFQTKDLKPTSKESYDDVFNTSFRSGSAPIMAQAKERMRQMSQGFGADDMTSGARRGLQLQSAQQTGSDLRDLSSDLSSTIAQNRLTNMQDVSKYNMDKFYDTQMNQADENFRVAGFGDQQSQFMANEALSRAKQMADIGGYIPNLQKDLYGYGLQEQQLEQKAFQDLLDMYGKLGQLGNSYG